VLVCVFVESWWMQEIYLECTIGILLWLLWTFTEEGGMWRSWCRHCDIQLTGHWWACTPVCDWKRRSSDHIWRHFLFDELFITADHMVVAAEQSAEQSRRRWCCVGRVCGCTLLAVLCVLVGWYRRWHRLSGTNTFMFLYVMLSSHWFSVNTL